MQSKNLTMASIPTSSSPTNPSGDGANFYRVCPASDYYVIGAPQVPKATMRLSNGKTFKMTAENISDQNIYVQSVRVNGRDWNTPFLSYKELKNGGRMEFVMGAQPNKSWGANTGIPK